MVSTWRQTLILFISLGQIHSIEREITFPIKAQAEECFYETALIGQHIEFDYQVVDGGSEGIYAIDFSITKPDGHPSITEWDKSENSHQVKKFIYIYIYLLRAQSFTSLKADLRQDI